ncbi:hypothetical protein [Pinisolibacter sp.]|uniref:hypothetical protein n=1 Tax=Pinisolibacter sp. TaxID=2172024 RepID=UPI002FDE8F44
MSTSKKILTAALVALTVATTGVVSTGTAEAAPWHHHHHRHHGWGWGAGGLATGLIIGSAIASQPAYAEPVRRCHRVERVNRWGEVIGTRRVCRVYE